MYSSLCYTNTTFIPFRDVIAFKPVSLGLQSFGYNYLNINFSMSNDFSFHFAFPFRKRLLVRKLIYEFIFILHGCFQSFTKNIQSKCGCHRSPHNASFNSHPSTFRVNTYLHATMKTKCLSSLALMHASWGMTIDVAVTGVIFVAERTGSFTLGFRRTQRNSGF